MPTKKADLAKKALPIERGRFAKLLEPGFVVEMSPARQQPPTPSATPKPAAPKR
jgi:hypothetical protein